MFSFKKENKKIFYLTAIILLLIFLHYLRILSPLESTIEKILQPISSILYSWTIIIKGRYIENSDKEKLLLKNKELEEKLSRIISDNVKLKALEEENKRLKAHLNFADKNKVTQLISNIIYSNNNFFLDSNKTIAINIGAKNGILKGLAVVNENGVIIGKIVNVKDNISEVCLIVNSNCKIAATIMGSDITNGIAEGDLGLTIKMNLIPQTTLINPGDVVVTSGLEKLIPRGLIIGIVSQVNKDNNALWQNAVIDPVVDFSKLITVAVIMPPS